MNLMPLFTRGGRLALAASLALLCAMPQAQPPGAAGPVGAGNPMLMGPEPEIKFVPARPVETVIAEIDGKPFTIAELQNWARYGTVRQLTGQVPPEKYPELPDSALNQLTRTIAARIAAARDVQALPDAEIAIYLEQTDPYIEQIVLSHLATTRITDRLTTPSEEVLTEHYEKNKDLYKVPFQFWMRHLVLLTYEKYSVREGDTLESIAGRISGDEKLADEIRADLPSRPSRRGEVADFKPLDPGETLLVPMSPQHAEAVRLKLEGLLKQLETGKTFEQLAAEFSESEAKGDEIGPIPSGTRPMLGELVDAGRETAVGEISPIFRTKHGFQVIQVSKKQEEGVRPYAEVRQIIINQMLNEERRKAETELLDGLYADSSRVVHYASFASSEGRTTSTVMAEVTGTPVKVLFSDIKDDWERRGQPRTQESVDAYMKTNRKLMVGLARVEASRLMQDPAHELNQRIKYPGSDVMGTMRLNELALEQASSKISDEEVAKFYEENKETYFKKPQIVSFALLRRELDQAQMEQSTEPELRQAALQGLLDSVKAEVGQFKTDTDFLNHQAIAAQEAGVSPQFERGTRLDSLPPQIREALEPLEVGAWSEPILFGEQVISVLLQERSEAGYLALDVVDDAVRVKLSETSLPAISDALRDEYAAKVGYKPLL